MVTGVGTSPTLDELVQRAHALLPAIGSRAAHCEEFRRVPDETIQELRAAGLFRQFVPARYGGFEMDYGPTQLAICREIGTACGSTAWVLSVLACHAWLVGMFPEGGQDVVWADGPDTIIASSFAPSTGAARAVDGGYILDGIWQFSSGVHAARWLVAAVPLPVGDERQLHFCLIPRADWEVLDTWYAAGLRGTGTNEVQVENAFVPYERTHNVSVADGRPTPGSAVNPCYIYRLPMWSVFPYNIASPGLGIARGAIEAYARETAARADKANQFGRLSRLAESAAEIDAGEALLQADAAEIVRLGRAGEVPAIETRLKWRRNLSFVVGMWVRAVDRLVTSVGAHSMVDTNPIQRASRDLHALANHAGLQWDTNGPMYGRFAVGLEPLSTRDGRPPI